MYRIHVLVLCTIISNTTLHFVVLSFILILQNLWPTNMELLIPIFLIEILTLQFFNESTKQDFFQCFTNYCASHFAYFQVLEDLHAIWDWILMEKLHIPLNERNMYSAILVVPDTFDNRGIYISNSSLLIARSIDGEISFLIFAIFCHVVKLSANWIFIKVYFCLWLE